jgi:dihydrofolate reductase
MKRLAMIAAVGSNGVIGVDGDLPWRIPADLKHFRRQTLGHSVVMGRKTWDSLGRPLKHRRNIVVTRQIGLKCEGAEVAHSLGDAITLARTDDLEPLIIGGAALYAAAMPQATRMFLTEVDQCPAGDTFFPDFDRGLWIEASREDHDGFSFVEWARRGWTEDENGL